MKKALLLILLGTTCLLSARAAETVDSVRMRIYYRTGYRFVEPGFRNNREALDRFTESIRRSLDDGSFEHIVVAASSSPDGNEQANERLAALRVDSLVAYIVRHTAVPEERIERHVIGVAWEALRGMVAGLDTEWRDEALEIIDHTPAIRYDAQGRPTGGRNAELMRLRGGAPYRYMQEHLFPELRSSVGATLYTLPEPPSVDEGPAQTVAEPEPEPVPAPEPKPAPEPERAPAATVAEPAADDGWAPRIRVKTNAVGWAMMIVNAAVEIDLSRRFSVNLPIYYSGCDYFSARAKFRILATQPELRVWPLRSRRLFAGVHFGVASYNFAAGGDWRIQDHAGHTPALGGGLNVGYRLPLGRTERWDVEFSLGAGAYRAHYDKFRNEHDGARATEVRKTFVGLDNAAVSFSYNFGLKKKQK